MRALYYDEQPRLRTGMPVPDPKPGEVLVRVLCAGICATDLEIFKGYMGFRGVPGHEFVGEVVGPEGSSWVGKRVVGEINCGCGACPRCAAGDQRHCPDRTVLGIAGRDGAFAEYLLLPERGLHEVPATLSNRASVFVEPVAAACRILEQVPDLPPRVLIIGDGKLGLLIAQVLVAHTEVHLVCHHPDRARSVTGDTAISHKGAGTSGGGRYRLVIEASGSPAGLAEALQAVEPEGTIILKSTYAGRPRIDVSLAVVVPEVTIRGSRCGPFPRALEVLAQGQINTASMIEAEFGLEAWEEAFRQASRPGALKVLFRFPDP
jgi:threonine dehydrogenase-like Zn-dependent dehydrogenase